MDEAAEGVVRGEIGGGVEGLLGDGADVVVLGRKQPFLDAFSVVGNSGRDGDWIFHQLHRDWAEEIAWDF